MRLKPDAPPFDKVLVERFTPTTLYRDWGTEQIVAETEHYMAKILKMQAGTKGGLQCHVNKDESFYLLSGEAWVEYDDGCGNLIGRYMYEGETYHIPPQAVHRVEALTDCVFIEGSTVAHDDRYHAESHYGLKEETGGLPSTYVWKDGEFVPR